MSSDAQLTNEVIHALLWDARVSPASIAVETKDGVVLLSGTVDSYIKKWSARETTFNVEAVKEVIDTIVVKPSTQISDETIKKNIKQMLENDSRVDAAEVEVLVKKGVVTLQGRVNSLFQKLGAEETTRWVKGVIDVKNRIKVQHQTRNVDKEIKRAVERMLLNNQLLKDCAISVTVENQVVSLNGEVAERKQRILAEALASTVVSVSLVKNRLNILQ